MKMCGIAGKLNFNQNKSVSENLIQKMTQTLNHRGPDDEGFFVKNNIGLGHKRLSIIDLSSAAHQPMTNEDRSLWIAYNGEIYNFQALKSNLIKKGHKFTSRSDAEVILHLYEEYKEKCLEKLRGMFAFAIWDDKEKKLFLARDRVGKKPLKYYFGKDFFVFASEAKAILQDSEIKKEPDWEAIHHYLTYQYVPHPLTGFKNIYKLPPAHYMVIDSSGKYEIKRYWKLNYSEKWNLPEKEWCQKILEKLEESVKLRMISDVPLGAFLSGGVDSSAIVGIMSKFSKKAIKTFSIGFKEGDYDETVYAKKMAKLFKTDHQEFIVKPNIFEIFPKLAYFYEEPYADSSAIPTFYLSEQTKKYVKVALNGDGGDENFAGYRQYNHLKVAYLWNKIPKPVRQIITFSSQVGFRVTKFPIFHKAYDFSSNWLGNAEKTYLNFICYFKNKEKEKIYTDSFRKKIGGLDSANLLLEKFNDSKTKNWLDRALYVDFNSYLPDDLMVKVDIATMANSIEGRSPLLDHEFLELTAKIPSNLKLKGRENKYIFKKALEEFLPKEILFRRKMGFAAPLKHWFRKELKDYTYQKLLSKNFIDMGIFKKEAIKEMLDKHQSNKYDYAKHIWALLALKHWFEQYFE